MKTPILYRKRVIPAECIELKNDVILRCDESVIVTSWKALHPKKDLDHGYSCYYLKRGIKVSLFIDHQGRTMYWYCDIVDYNFSVREETGASVLTVTDLLTDVILYPDGRLKVVDLDELADAFEQQLIDKALMICSLKNCSRLLEIIYSKQFSSLEAPILEIISKEPVLNTPNQ